ncbi:MAG: helix-hairpin-helix domain-containing protein [Pseudomonadota bacterium]
MLKKLLIAIVTLFASMGFALADVDVNKGDQAAFDGIKGLGPSTSKAIIAARSKRGNFKDWPDFQIRVKGIGEKSAVKLSDAGLTVNGQSKSAATAQTAASNLAKPPASTTVPVSK